MASHYLLQIVDERGVVAKLPAGGKLERDLIESFVAKLPYAGVLRTDAQVRAAMRCAITAAITELKRETIQI